MFRRGGVTGVPIFQLVRSKVRVRVGVALVHSAVGV